MALRGSGKTASGTHVGVVHVRSANDQRTSFVVVVVWFFLFFCCKAVNSTCWLVRDGDGRCLCSYTDTPQVEGASTECIFIVPCFIASSTRFLNRWVFTAVLNAAFD